MTNIYKFLNSFSPPIKNKIFDKQGIPILLKKSKIIKTLLLFFSLLVRVFCFPDVNDDGKIGHFVVNSILEAKFLVREALLGGLIDKIKSK